MKFTKAALLSSAFVAGLFFTSCQSDVEGPNFGDVPGDVLDRLADLGFNTTEVVKVEDGFVVEKDILMTYDEIMGMQSPLTVVDEHYHTTNLVTGTPRTITVRCSITSTKFQDALDEAISRYNAENLDLTFQKVSSGGDIVISASPWYYALFGILGSAGFPTAGGDPHNSILMTTSYYSSAPVNGVATVMAHEMGHCIGFRHTDYMDRSYSCGGAADNEGDGGVGAIHIPGTPTGPSANSWMLACGSASGNRPFTAEDKTALSTLY